MTIAPAPLSPSPAKSPLPGPKILLLGPSGTGKTFSLRTLIDTGITPMCIFAEQGFEVLGDIPSDKLHWHYISSVTDSLESLTKKVTDISMLDQSSLAKMRDPNRHKDNKMLEFVKSLNDFSCDRTGDSFGPVAKWGTNRALVMDSLTGLSDMAWHMILGARPLKDKPDYGLVQDLLESQIKWLCNLRCMFILIAHAERETDEVRGGSKLMSSAPGKKLAPILPRHFSDVILTKRQGAKFLWDTVDPEADLKARNLPLAGDLAPSFSNVIETWKKHGGLIE